jgi:hypothetical protein
VAIWPSEGYQVGNGSGGTQVVVLGINVKGGKKNAAEIETLDSRSLFFEADISDPTTVDQAVDQPMHHF